MKTFGLSATRLSAILLAVAAAGNADGFAVPQLPAESPYLDTEVSTNVAIGII